METINDRIAAVVKRTGLTKTAFAEKINLSQTYVSNICVGRKVPSDRTIFDICKTFDVNEDWLRTGNGEMFISVSDKEAEIAAIMRSIMGDKDPEFCRRFSAALARLDETGWDLIEKMVMKLAGEENTAANTYTVAAEQSTPSVPAGYSSRAELEAEAREVAEAAYREFLERKRAEVGYLK